MLDDMNVADIYVRTTGYLLPIIHFLQCRKNSQHSMSANTDFNNISMDKYKQEIFPTFVLALQLYVIPSFTLLYLEVISSIKY